MAATLLALLISLTTTLLSVIFQSATTLLSVIFQSATTLLSSSLNCNYAVGSGVSSICAQTCWRLQQKLYSKLCLAELSQIRQAWHGKMTHRYSLQPLFFGLAKQEKIISTARNDQKKNTMELPRKKRLKIAETSRLMHFVSKRLFTNVNAATRGFRSGGLFMSSLIMIQLCICLLIMCNCWIIFNWKVYHGGADCHLFLGPTSKIHKPRFSAAGLTLGLGLANRGVKGWLT